MRQSNREGNQFNVLSCFVRLTIWRKVRQHANLAMRMVYHIPERRANWPILLLTNMDFLIIDGPLYSRNFHPRLPPKGLVAAVWPSRVAVATECVNTSLMFERPRVGARKAKSPTVRDGQ